MAGRERTVLLVFLALALVGVAVAAVLLRGSGPAQPRVLLPEISTWLPHRADMERQRSVDTKVLGNLKVRPHDRALLEALSDFHREEIMSGANITVSSYREATEAYRRRVRRYVRDYGVQRYVRLGLWAQHRFLKALADLNRSTREAGATLAHEVAHHPARDDVVAMLAFGGDFVDWAVAQGILDPGGKVDPAKVFLAGTLFKLRWLRWSQDIEPVDAHLTRFEKRMVLAYRVEAARGVPVDRKLELIAELEAVDPGYPARAVAIVLLARAGRIEQAERRLEAGLAKSPGDPVLRRLQRALAARRAALTEARAPK